jgi:hypothetical protein
MKIILKVLYLQKVKREMKCMRTTAGYDGRDYKTNTVIVKVCSITPVLEKIQAYRINRLQHVNRMPW